jgi:drug/metabolite transporter (DMT)-like permease
LGSGIGYALYSIFGKYAIRNYSTLTITTYAFFFASISSIPLANFTGELKYFEFTTLWSALGLAALSTVIPYLLYTWGLEEVEAGRASILATVEPLVAAAVGIAVYSEPVTLHKLLGTLLICSSIILLNIPKKESNQ